jgi:hypothetical protein
MNDGTAEIKQSHFFKERWSSLQLWKWKLRRTRALTTSVPPFSPYCSCSVFALSHFFQKPQSLRIQIFRSLNRRRSELNERRFPLPLMFSGLRISVIQPDQSMREGREKVASALHWGSLVPKARNQTRFTSNAFEKALVA